MTQQGYVGGIVRINELDKTFLYISDHFVFIYVIR